MNILKLILSQFNSDDELTVKILSLPEQEIQTNLQNYSKLLERNFTVSSNIEKEEGKFGYHILCYLMRNLNNNPNLEE
jgi:hypothetical protein